MSADTYDSEDIFEPLDWATGWAGATEIRVKNPKTGVFETV